MHGDTGGFYEVRVQSPGREQFRSGARSRTMSNVTRDSTISAELRHELQRLRADNERLRSLLGLNDLNRLDPVAPWEPTLFQDTHKPSRTPDR